MNAVPAQHAIADQLACHAMIDAGMPFGGYKQSGFGREQGRAGIEMYTELKSVFMAIWRRRDTP